MTSYQKIEEAKYFLGLINENFQDDAKCEYCVSAFLSACYSVMDHTLEEYYIHFHLKIKEWGLDVAKFHKAALDAKNDDAVGFVKLYCSERYKVDTNPLSAALLNLRNENIHTSMNLTPFGTFVGETTETRFFLGPVDAALPYFRDGLKSFVRSRQKSLFRSGILSKLECRQLSEDELDNLSNNALNLLSNTELLAACEMHFKTLNGFVNAIRAKYPRW